MILIGPFSLDFHFHYPDEMYYTDAAMRMMTNGDYFTTYLGNGELRFKKPIITYWAVLAGFKLFGISAFSSRIFFLFTGSALIGLVYAIGKLASGNKSVASLAAWIVAAQPLVIFSSSRSIPDILLVLFLTLSAWGTTAILKFGNGVPKRYLWMLYLGFGLAFEVKGLPAAALAFLTLTYLLINPWQKITWRTLLYWPALLLGTGIAISWFIVMYVKFGPVYLDSFLEDQVGMRVGNRVVKLLSYFLMAVGLMAALFLPWLFFVGKKLTISLAAIREENKPFFGFILVWLVAIILMTSLVSKFYDRYLLPVLPVVAVGVAWMIVQGNRDNKKMLTGWTSFLVILNTIILAVAVYWNVGLKSPPLLILPWIFGAAIVVFLFVEIRKKRLHYHHVSIAMMLVFFCSTLISHPLSIPHQGIQIRQLVSEKNIPKGTRFGFVGNPHHSSKIRIGLGTDYEVVNLGNDYATANRYPYLIRADGPLEGVPVDSGTVEVASSNWDAKYFTEIMKGIWAGDSHIKKEDWSKRYLLIEQQSHIP